MLAAALLAALSVPLLSGCQPASSPRESLLSSRFYDRAETRGDRGTAPGQFNKPRALALDREDHLYVADMTGRVQKFAPDGSYLLLWHMPETDLGKPKGMTRDADGNIVVIEPHYSRINHFAPDGKLLAQWGQRGDAPGSFSLPRAIVFDDQGDAFVCEYSRHDRVQRFAGPDHRFQHVLGRAGTGPGELNRPEGLALDAQGLLYVADSCNHRIQIFGTNGQFLAAFGRPGTGLGELSYPTDIVLDRQGRQYVCEYGNSRIQVFDPAHQPLETIGGPGREPGQFSNPWALAADSQGNLFVADTGNHRIQRFRRRAVQSAGRANPLLAGGTSRIESSSPRTP